MFFFFFFYKISLLRVCFISPIKAAHFEAHISKLQADSNYLLSEEFEVRRTSDDLVFAFSTSIGCPIASLLLSDRISRMWDGTKVWMLHVYLRTAARIDTTIYCHVSLHKQKHAVWGENVPYGRPHAHN